MTNWLKDIPLETNTDRDVEIPCLLEFIEQNKPESLLDVGAHWSHAYYARQVGDLVPNEYKAIDILPDLKTAALVDEYAVGDVNEIYKAETELFDMVICVSTIEHAGISTYQVEDYRKERQKLFEKCLLLATKQAWFSFPIGQEHLIEGQLGVVSLGDMINFRAAAFANKFNVKERYFYTQGAPVGHVWREHDDFELATKIPYIEFIGNQSLCVMELNKET